METLHIINFHPIFSECATCLSKRLQVGITSGDLIPGHTYIIFGSHNQAPILYSNQIQKPYIKYIIINGEPPQSNVLKNKYYIELMKNNVVFDYHPLSTIYLKSLGIKVIGHYDFEFPLYNFSKTNLRDIDILFIGSYNKRRESIFETLKKHYPEKKIIFHLDWKHQNQIELTKELCRAKIVLNIPYYESNILETHRINKAISCGCKVVSLYSGHAETDNFYSSYIYMCDDFLKLFNNCEKNIEIKKKDYKDLINAFELNFSYNKTAIKDITNSAAGKF